MPVTIRVVNRKRCQYMLPCFSEGLKGGKILLKEDQCLLPAGHDGPHRSALGWVHNAQGTERLIEQGKI